MNRPSNSGRRRLAVPPPPLHTTPPSSADYPAHVGSLHTQPHAPESRPTKKKRPAGGGAFQSEAAPVHRHITIIALVFLILGFVGLVLYLAFQLMYVGAVSNVLFRGEAGGIAGVILIGGALISAAFGAVTLYLSYLILRALALTVKYLAVIADHSR